jgi:hypothetical protein
LSARLRLPLAAIALLFLVTHLRALPQTLEDIDSINFAMGVEDFDVARHQPHPPGYPVFIALAKASTAAVGAVAPGWDRDRRAAAGLAIWGVLAGAIAVFVVARFWIAAGLAPAIAAMAAVVCVASPLFWFTAARPLTDSAGLVAAVGIQAALVAALDAVRRADASAGRQIAVAAFASGLAIGFRSQILWLTGPLLVWALGSLARRGHWRGGGVALAAAAAGVVVWAAPLVWLSGGLTKYVAAVRFQGGQDLTGIELLSTHWSGRLFNDALNYTFAQPWQHPNLARVVLILSVAGVAHLALTARRTLAIVVVAFVPYLLFHLAFQETVTIRYALPMVVPVAGLTVVEVAGFAGVLTRRRRDPTVRDVAAIAGGSAIAIASIVLTQPGLDAYARDGAPVFRAFQAMLRARATAPVEPVVRMHHQVWWGVNRVIDWYRGAWPIDKRPHPGDREWLDVVEHWRRGGSAPVWFLGDLSRTDLVLFDPRSRRLEGRYELSPDVRRLIGGARLDSLTWTTIERPGWMLGRGWALAPEVSGMTGQDRTWPHVRPADAYLLRRSDPMRLLIAGRRLDGSAPARVTVAIDGADVAALEVPGDALSFLQWIALPSGVAPGSDPYAHATVGVASTDASRPAPLLSLEQFDAAPEEQIAFAYLADWHEPEGSATTGRLWRWTSGRSTLEIRGASRDVEVTIAGESPLVDFDRAPTVVVRAGDRELARFSPAAPFTERILVPAAALSAAGGHITLETDLTFSPSERGQSADPRRLGLKIYSVTVK